MREEVRLTSYEIDVVENIAKQHGIPFALDHLGLDGLGNEVQDLKRRVVNLETALRNYIDHAPDIGPWHGIFRSVVEGPVVNPAMSGWQWHEYER